MSDKKILVVDDEPNNLQLLRQVLKEDYTLVFAKTGREALEVANKHLPDLILMDVMMPEMNGYEACLQLKKSPETDAIPVLFVTAMNDIEAETLGFDVGGVDYITKPISASTVKARIKTHLSLTRIDELKKSQRDSVFMLGDAGHYNDEDTGVHIWRMAAYSRAIAKSIGWSDEQCELIELAAPMHDTGKIGIPDKILKKPAKLDADEWDVMRQHTEIGHKILSKSNTPLFKMAAEIALSHHEKWDGKGYPYGLSGSDIPESSRIVAIADVFDALTMSRPYKEAWSIDKAAQEIRRNSGSHFEPRLVDAFEKILPELLMIKERWEGQTEPMKIQ